MMTLDAGFSAALSAARDQGIAPVYFVWITAKDRDTGAAVGRGFWSGDDDSTITVPALDGGGSVSRLFLGGCNLAIEGLQSVGDLTDRAVTVALSQIAPAVQDLVRGADVRLASCEIYATSMTGGALVSAPQLQWVGLVDDGPIATPSAGGEGGVALSVRSEIMAMLTAVNPAKSSDAHQRRRAAGDLFCKYASVISSRRVQWFYKKD